MKKNLLIVFAYSFFLLSAPYFTQLMVPCLKRIPGRTFTYETCNAVYALDRYLLIALSGLTVSMSFLYYRSNSHVKNIPISILLTFLLIMSYYLYLPSVFSRTQASSIYLDSLK